MKRKNIQEIKEAFKPFKARNRDYWSISWRRDNPDEKGTTAIMFDNTVLNQSIRLEETKEEKYKIEIREGEDLVSSDIFEEFKKAKEYVINYMKNASEKVEKMITSKGLFEKLFTKTMVETTQRSIDKENHLFKEQTEEYLRNLNTIINNDNLDKKVINKAKKIRDYVKEIYTK